MTRRAISVLLTLAIVAGGCRQPAKQGRQLTPLKVEFIPLLTYAPLAIAREKGYFRDEGIDAQFIWVHADALTPAVLTGKMDVFASNMNLAALNAMARGGRIVFVADKSYYPSTGCSSDWVMIRNGVNETELTNPEYLKTLKVSWSNSTTQPYLMDRLFNSLHVSLADLKKVPLQSESVIPAFQSKAIDVRIISEPRMTEIREQGVARPWKAIRDVLPDSQSGVIGFGPRLLDQDRPLGVRFIRAYLRGVATYNQGKTQENIDIINRLTHLDKKSLAATCWPAFHADGSIFTDSVLDYEKWGRSNGLLDREVTPDRFWDGSFIAEARAKR